MARPKKPTDTLKDQRVPIMMSEDELKALDDWMFENRIRSRGDAIRRLVQMGILAHGARHQLHEGMGNLAERILTLSKLIREAKLKPNSGIDLAKDDLLETVSTVYTDIADLGISVEALGEGDISEAMDDVRAIYAKMEDEKS